MNLTNQGGPGKLTTIFMRGAESDHVLVLVDGVRIGSATAGLAAFQDLPVDQIERIEIVRGPRSSLYGSEAIGGVIQGVRRWRTDEPLPWLLIAATITLYLAGAIAREVSSTLADVLDLTGYTTAILGVYLLGRRRAHDRDPTSLVTMRTFVGVARVDQGIDGLDYERGRDAKRLRSDLLAASQEQLVDVAD